MDDSITEKKCKKCGETKPNIEFNMWGDWCKTCRKGYQRNYRLKHEGESKRVNIRLSCYRKLNVLAGMLAVEYNLRGVNRLFSIETAIDEAINSRTTKIINPKVENGTKEIRLTQNMVSIVDYEDYIKLSKYKWCFGGGYARRVVGSRGKLKNVFMHREILGAKRGELVDHIDGNKLNNQKANLRLCTRIENQRNRGISKMNTSGYKGVSYCKDTKKNWRSIICVGDGDQVILGYYSTKEEAAFAYDKAAKIYHGEFAHLNFCE